MNPILRTLQEDFHARALAAASLASTAVILQRKALTPAEVESQLRTLKGRSGKVGTCLLVQMPELRPANPNLPGPQMPVVVSLVAIEHPEINRLSNGSGVSAEELVIAVLQLFHHFQAGGLTFVAAGVVPDDSVPGFVRYDLAFNSDLALLPETKVARPAFARDEDGFVSLTCATPAAEIYYTVDGSYPSPENADAEHYATPFAASAGWFIRAAASADGLQQSDVAQLTL